MMDSCGDDEGGHDFDDFGIPLTTPGAPGAANDHTTDDKIDANVDNTDTLSRVEAEINALVAQNREILGLLQAKNQDTVATTVVDQTTLIESKPIPVTRDLITELVAMLNDLKLQMGNVDNYWDVNWDDYDFVTKTKAFVAVHNLEAKYIVISSAIRELKKRDRSGVLQEDEFKAIQRLMLSTWGPLQLVSTADETCTNSTKPVDETSESPTTVIMSPMTISL
ncbi:hypothetical protein F5Y18DRAFT_437259 [Xylariaceae sp. FL1019]|nr:hypothetical protein F5Y18DRAFT_437259 [Xylariaceae sp. FL1019]